MRALLLLPLLLLLLLLPPLPLPVSCRCRCRYARRLCCGKSGAAAPPRRQVARQARQVGGAQRQQPRGGGAARVIRARRPRGGGDGGEEVGVALARRVALPQELSLVKGGVCGMAAAAATARARRDQRSSGVLLALARPLAPKILSFNTIFIPLTFLSCALSASYGETGALIELASGPCSKSCLLRRSRSTSIS